MLERKRITLDDKQIFATYFYNQDNSTYNFTNMFMWEQEGGITYAEICDCLVLFFQFGKNPPMVSYPLGNGDKKAAIAMVCEYLNAEGVRPLFRNLSEWMKEELEEIYPDKFEFIYDRNNSDYVYEIEQLITLKGKKLHQKRNHFNYFKNNYQFEYRRLTEDDMSDCKKLFDAWISDKDEDIESARKATYAVIDNFTKLDVVGGGIWVDGALSAASFAEPVTEDTVLAHLEFGKPDIRGIFNAINQQFCEHEWSSYSYINREEDMGLDGLRQAKLAYRPIRFVDKYAAVLKDKTLV